VNCLIIGGNRFVGKRLAKELIWLGNEVTVFNRSGTGPSNVNIIKGNRNTKKDIDKIDFSKYDCVVDMCLYKIEQFELVKDLIPKDTNYIFVSSGAVDCLESFGEYGIEKKNVEEALIKTNLNYKIIRPSYIVGENDHTSRLDYFISKLKNRQPIEISGDGNYPINLIFAEDVMKCLLSQMYEKNKTHKIYYVCSDESITINELIDYIKNQLGIKNHKTIDSEEALFLNQVFEFDNSDIKKDYEINFINVKDGIKNYIEGRNEF
tara:strand:- start:75 stop:866 length:792 start_codon:yes stop_codon:yes gene_type:complete